MLNTALVLAASMVVGQTSGGMPQEVRAHIDKHIIGEWTTQTTWGGKVAEGESKARWGQGGASVITETTGVDFAGDRVHVTTVLGWDADAKCIVDYSVTSKGERWNYRWTDFSGDTWAGQGVGIYNGKEWHSPAKIRWEEDSSTYEDTTEGKPFVIVSERKVSHIAQQAGTTAVPAAVLEQFQYFVGEWTAEGTTGDGEAAQATFTVKWAPGKKTLLFDAYWSDPEIKSLGSGIFGWDAADERVHTSEFWDNGVYHHRHYTIKSDRAWEGDEFAGINDEGKRVRQKVKLEIRNPNEWTWEASERVLDGKLEQGEGKLTFHRK